MTDKSSHWIQAFNDCEIPVLHISKLRLYELEDNEQDITVTILADIARQDPGLSITLLRHAGRSHKKEITTLFHAISLISMPIVKRMLTNAPELEKVQDKKTVSKFLNIYAFQHQTAYMAKQWSLLRKESENKELFTAGLNRSFISFMLHLIDPEKATQIEKLYFQEDVDYSNKERELLGYSIDELSELIAKNWNLPELIRESYSGKHHNPKITGIRLATELIHEIYTYSSIQYREELITRVAEYMRIDINQAPGKVNQILINSIRDSWKHLPYIPLLKMIMCYQPPIKTETNKTTELSKQVALSDYLELLQSNDSQRPTRELIEIAISAMIESVGFSRVVFMSFDADEKCLKMSLQKTDNQLPKINQFSIALELNKLFNQLLKKEQTLCINSKNQHKFSNLLPTSLRPMRPNATIIINSLYVNKRISGCLFVDHGQTDKQLTSHELQSFKTIFTALKAAIESTILKRKSAIKAA